MMTTVTIELPETVFSALRLAPNELVRQMRIAAAVQWYAQQQVSQGKASEIAGLSRAEFLAELLRRKVPAVQVTPEELQKELAGDW
jgi:predicted HTH domain antitoxin